MSVHSLEQIFEYIVQYKLNIYKDGRHFLLLRERIKRGNSQKLVYLKVCFLTSKWLGMMQIWILKLSLCNDVV